MCLVFLTCAFSVSHLWFLFHATFLCFAPVFSVIPTCVLCVSPVFSVPHLFPNLCFLCLSPVFSLFLTCFSLFPTCVFSFSPVISLFHTSFLCFAPVFSVFPTCVLSVSPIFSVSHLFPNLCFLFPTCVFSVYHLCFLCFPPVFRLCPPVWHLCPVFQTASGNVEAKVVCFYRRRDISHSLIQLADKHASESDLPALHLYR